MNVQKEEKVEDSLEQLMRGEEGDIVEDYFDKIQKQQEQDENEEEEVGIFVMRECAKKLEFVGEKYNNRQLFVMIER